MAYNTIKLTKYSDVIVERIANATITPGMLVERMSTGNVRAHATAGSTVAPIMFALENELEGEGIDTDYTANDKVQVWIPYRGDIVYALLADNANIAIGDKLESNGDGMLREWTPLNSETAGHENSLVAVAEEAVDTTASLEAGTRIKVRIV